MARLRGLAAMHAVIAVVSTRPAATVADDTIFQTSHWENEHLGCMGDQNARITL